MVAAVQLNHAIAARFMQIGLGHVAREYPHYLEHVLDDVADLRPPRELHPVFFGSVDWASCVHGWWLLLTCARLFPALPEAAQVRDLAIGTFTRAHVEAELAYLVRPSAAGFARPYGWAWLLTLHAEAVRHHQPWARTLDPLAALVAVRLGEWLPAARPVRGGGRHNTAFALIHAHAWAGDYHAELALALAAAARDWYADQAAETAEPDDEAFLSPLLTEAHCLQRLLPAAEFEAWLHDRLPDIDQGRPGPLFETAHGDAGAHRDGLNLSRAWSWNALGERLPLGHLAHGTAERFLGASLRHVAGDPRGEHWLASYALLALLPGCP